MDTLVPAIGWYALCVYLNDDNTAEIRMEPLVGWYVDRDGRSEFDPQYNVRGVVASQHCRWADDLDGFHLYVHYSQDDDIKRWASARYKELLGAEQELLDTEPKSDVHSS